MSLLFRGRTHCVLCGNVIGANDIALGFPHLFLNRRMPTAILNDAVVHESCLSEQEYASIALNALTEFEVHRKRPRRCDICGQLINQPASYIGLGRLVDDASEPLHEFNWFQAHKVCLQSWSRREELITALLKASRSLDWEGDALERLVNEIQSAPKEQ